MDGLQIGGLTQTRAQLHGCLHHNAQREARLLKIALRRFNGQRCGHCWGRALGTAKDAADDEDDNDDVADFLSWGELRVRYLQPPVSDGTIPGRTAPF